MSDSSSRSRTAGLIIRIVLPLVALVLGTMFFIFGVFSFRAPPLLRAELFVAGGAAGVSGFLALYWSIRTYFSDNAAVRAVAAVRADMASGGIFALIGLVGAAGATHDLRSDSGPPQVIAGRIGSVVPWTSSRGLGREIHLNLAGQPDHLRWHCAFDCEPYHRLLKLQTQVGQPVRITKIGDRLIGLSAQGLEVLGPDPERDRLKAQDGWMWVAFAAIALGAGIYIPWRGRRGMRELPFDPRPRDYRRLVRDRLTGRREPPG